MKACHLHEHHSLPPQAHTPAKRKVWGGHTLEPMMGVAPTGKAIGEAWLIHESSRIANGAWAGRTLGDVTAEHPQNILGAQHATNVIDGVARFPLLAKFLDPQEWLSVQVHPDDAYARAREGQPYGKCEAWYVLRADPPAQIIHGLSQPISRQQLINAAKTGAIKTMMDYVDVQRGDVVVNMPGTIHALGAGVVIYEIQQSSDITYRLYDWDRPASAGRALHLEQSADVSDYTPYALHTTKPIALGILGAQRQLLCACRYFAAERLDLQQEVTEHTRGHSPHLLTMLSGSGDVQVDETTVEIVAGDSVVVPAATGSYTLKPQVGLTLIKSYVPDLAHDVVEPLRAHGVNSEAIAQLGGELRKS